MTNLYTGVPPSTGPTTHPDKQLGTSTTRHRETIQNRPQPAQPRRLTRAPLLQVRQKMNVPRFTYASVTIDLRRGSRAGAQCPRGTGTTRTCSSFHGPFDVVASEEGTMTFALLLADGRTVAFGRRLLVLFARPRLGLTRLCCCSALSGPTRRQGCRRRRRRCDCAPRVGERERAVADIGVAVPGVRVGGVQIRIDRGELPQRELVGAGAARWVSPVPSAVPPAKPLLPYQSGWSPLGSLTAASDAGPTPGCPRPSAPPGCRCDRQRSRTLRPRCAPQPCRSSALRPRCSRSQKPRSSRGAAWRRPARAR